MLMDPCNQTTHARHPPTTIFHCHKVGTLCSNKIRQHLDGTDERHLD